MSEPVIACPNCKKEFDQSSYFCPECFKDVKSNSSKLAIIFPSSLIVLAAIIGCVFYFIYTDSFSSLFPSGVIDKEERAGWGALGDFFGGLLNPILTFLSLVLLAVTLRLNQIELSLTRKEVAKSSKALKEQAGSLELQNFENTFFKILDLYNTNVRTLVAKGHMGDCSSRDCFIQLSTYIKDDLSSDNELKKMHSTDDVDITAIREEIVNLESTIRNYVHNLSHAYNPSSESELQKTRERLTKLNKKLSNHLVTVRSVNDKARIAKVVNQAIRILDIQSLDHYLSTVVLLLDYVNKKNDSVDYYDLIRSQMSTEEIYFLFYATISVPNSENLKMLCSEAALFKEVNPEDFAYGKNHWQHHKNKAFDGNLKGLNFSRTKAGSSGRVDFF